MTDEAAMLAAILDRPREDTPRLVFADWLDDHGEPERAEFIRVQCELAGLRAAGLGCNESGRPDCCPPGYARLRDRESHLWGHGFGGLSLDPPLTTIGLHYLYTINPGDVVGIVARGFPDELRVPTLAVLLGGACGRCGGTGEDGGHPYDRGVVGWCRGCWDSTAQRSSGRTPGIAAAVFKLHPVARVMVGGGQPRRVDDMFGGGYTWSRRPDGCRLLPETVRELAPIGGCLPIPLKAGYRRWENPQGVIDAESAALVDHCRGIVGLAPIYVPEPTPAA